MFRSTNKGGIKLGLDLFFNVQYNCTIRWRHSMKTTFITFFSLKGGVGKTTTTLNVAFALKELGKKVLVVDFDPGSSLSMWLGHDSEGQEDNTILSYLLHVYFLLVQKKADKGLVDFDKRLMKTIFRSDNGMDYISNGQTLMIQLEQLKDLIQEVPDWKTHFRNMMESFTQEYDYVLFDTHPVDDLSSNLPLNIADGVVVISTFDGFIFRAYEDTVFLLNRLKLEGANFQFLGGIINRYRSKSKTTQKVYEQAQFMIEQGDMILFNDFIPDSEKIFSGPASWTNVFSSKSKLFKPIQEIYLNIANELISKTNGGNQ